MYHLQKLHFLRRSLNALNNIKLYSNRVFEPEYLDALKPSSPLYDTLNIYMRGYDYPILENYQKLVHKLAINMEIDVEESWPLPHQDWSVKTFKPNSELVNAEYKLKMYQRVIQVTDVSTLQLPILLRTLEASVPAGVTVSVSTHTEFDDEVRYIPDTDLLQLKQELEEIDSIKKKKKK